MWLTMWYKPCAQCNCRAQRYIYTKILGNFFKKEGILALDEIIPVFVVAEDDTVSNILVWFSVFGKILKFFIWISHLCRSGVFLVVHELLKWF